MRKTAGVLLVVLAACGGSTADLNPVWVQMVDSRAGDCAGLQEAFDNTNDVDEMEYVDAALRESGCYD